MGRLVPIAENATNSPAFHGIKNILRKNGVVVDTLYLSNIANFMNDSNKQKALVRSIRNLIDMKTTFKNIFHHLMQNITNLKIYMT